jgi:hypothetical protein
VPGNTSDKTTLPAMLALVQQRHGQANRIWVMDRGIPTVAALAQMRGSTPPVHYLDGTPKARLNRMEAALAERPWVEARGQLRVKRVPEDGEMYVLTESPARVDKERAMRRCALKKYWKRLGELTRLKQPKRDELLLKVGTAAGETGAAAHLVVSEVSPAGILTYHLVRDTRATARGAPPGGPLLLHTNLTDYDPEALWRTICIWSLWKRPFVPSKVIWRFVRLSSETGTNRSPPVVALLAYCLTVTLRQQLRGLAAGLMPRVVLKKLATVQMLDVHIPTNYSWCDALSPNPTSP